MRIADITMSPRLWLAAAENVAMLARVLRGIVCPYRGMRETRTAVVR